MELIILTITGILAGIISGSLGHSAAIIILPILVLFNIVDNYKIAVGTTIFIIFISSITSLLVHHKNEHINWKIALYLGVITAISSYCAADYMKKINHKTLSMFNPVLYLLLFILWIYITYNIKYE